MNNVVSMIRYHFLLSLIPLLQCCELADYELELKLDGCFKQKVNKVTVKACRGHCASEMRPTIKPPYFVSDCYCCQMVVFRQVQFPLECRTRRRKGRLIRQMVTVRSAESCQCRKCDQSLEISSPEKHRRSSRTSFDNDNFLLEYEEYEEEDEGTDEVLESSYSEDYEYSEDGAAEPAREHHTYRDLDVFR